MTIDFKGTVYLAVLVVSFSLPSLSVAQLKSPLAAAVAKLNSGQKGNKGTVLVVISSADKVPLKNGKMHETGYFLRELTDPLAEVLLAGYDVEFATPGGKTPVVDKNSLKLAWYGFPNQLNASQKLKEAVALKNSIIYLNGKKAPIDLVKAQQNIQNYVGLLVPGGHAPMVDLRYDQNLGAILRDFNKKKIPMAFVCHGPIALLSANSENGWPFKGYRVTVVSADDEKLLESNIIAPLIGPIEGKLVDYPDVELEKAGAILANSPIAGTPSLSQDREVITAQNPAAATAVGKILVRSIQERLGQRKSDSSVPDIPDNLTLSDLAQMNSEQLTTLYGKGSAEKIPTGDTVGLGLIFTGFAQINYFSSYVWQGKIFTQTADGGVELVNKIFGYTEFAKHKVDAQVTISTSRFDNKPTIQLDYSSSDVALARPVLDEIRKVAPNLYLGKVSFKKADLGFFALYFID